MTWNPTLQQTPKIGKTRCTRQLACPSISYYQITITDVTAYRYISVWFTENCGCIKLWEHRTAGGVCEATICVIKVPVKLSSLIIKVLASRFVYMKIEWNEQHVQWHVGDNPIPLSKHTIHPPASITKSHGRSEARKSKGLLLQDMTSTCNLLVSSSFL